jgi:hypothetical protein
MEDEGRPLGVGYQEQAPNHPKRLRLRGVGRERWGQSDEEHLAQVRVRETSASKPTDDAS